MDLVASLTDGVLLWQVACEPQTRGHGMNPRQAYADLRGLRDTWAPALPSWEVMDRAERLMDSGNLPLWDALIVAARLEAGVNRLYSEDFDASTTAFTGVAVINPFV